MRDDLAGSRRKIAQQPSKHAHVDASRIHETGKLNIQHRDRLVRARKRLQDERRDEILCAVAPPFYPSRSREFLTMIPRALANPITIGQIAGIMCTWR